jgi:phosphate/sulfate permease
MTKFTFTDIFPIIGAASGATEANKMLEFKSIAVYILLTILGALVGYVIKSLLDLLELNKRILNLKTYLKNLNKNKDVKK